MFETITRLDSITERRRFEMLCAWVMIKTVQPTETFNVSGKTTACTIAQFKADYGITI